MSRWFSAVAISLFLLSASTASAKTLTLANLNQQTSAHKLRQLRRALFRVGVQGARVDLSTGRLFLTARTRIKQRRLARLLERVGFPLETATAQKKSLPDQPAVLAWTGPLRR